MLFQSSLRKELARTFVATLVVLITVVMSMMLIRVLGLASSGRVNPQDVMMLMGYSVLGHLSTILTLSLFVAVTSTMGRLYRDSEMAIWFSSGQGLASFCVPVLRFAWPILVTIALLALVVWPWSNQQTQQLRQRFESRGELDRVAAGQFQENAAGTRVFFIERDDALTSTPTPLSSADATATAAALASKTARNVFVLSTDAGKQAVTSARTGRIERIEGDQFLLLGNGQRMEQSIVPNTTATSEQSALRISEFAEYGIKVGQNISSQGGQINPRTLRTNQLLRDPTDPHMAELSWRLGLACSAFNLVLLALVLSATNPRAGRGYGLIFSLLAFIAYYNMLNAGFSWVSTGRFSLTQVMLGLHGGVLVATCLLLALRNSNGSLRSLLATLLPKARGAQRTPA
jgi:lipopolysaccharide export system permease protein